MRIVKAILIFAVEAYLPRGRRRFPKKLQGRFLSI